MSDLNWVGPEVAKTWPKGSLVMGRQKRTDGGWHYGNVSDEYRFVNENLEYILVERAKESVAVHVYRNKKTGRIDISTRPDRSKEMYDLIASR